MLRGPGSPPIAVGLDDGRQSVVMLQPPEEKASARSAACFGPRPHAVRLRWVRCGFPLIPATRLSHPASLNVILDRIIVRRFTSRDSAEKASGPLTCKPASSSSSAVTGIAVPHTSTVAVSGWGSMRM